MEHSSEMIDTTVKSKPVQGDAMANDSLYYYLLESYLVTQHIYYYLYIPHSGLIIRFEEIRKRGYSKLGFNSTVDRYFIGNW